MRLGGLVRGRLGWAQLRASGLGLVLSASLACNGATQGVPSPNDDAGAASGGGGSSVNEPGGGSTDAMNGGSGPDGPSAAVDGPDAGAGGDCAAPSGSVSSERFVATFVEAMCCAVATCCASSGFAFAGDTCLTDWTREAEHLLADTNPSRVYDGAGAAKCIETSRSILSRCVSSTSVLAELKKSCPGVYAGTVDANGPCQSTKDCAQSAQGPVQCEVDTTTVGPPAPICVLDPPALLGEVCLGPGPRDPSSRFPHLVCAQGLYCDATNHCQMGLAAGAACGNSAAQCAPALWCETPGNTCVPLTALGTPCSTDAQCTSGSCYQQKCAPGIPISAAGCSPPPP